LHPLDEPLVSLDLRRTLFELGVLLFDERRQLRQLSEEFLLCSSVGFTAFAL